MTTLALNNRFFLALALAVATMLSVSACTSQPGVKQALSQTSTQKTKKAKTKTAKTRTVKKAQALAPAKQKKPSVSEQKIAAATANNDAGKNIEISFLPPTGIPQTAQTKFSKSLYQSAGKYDVALQSQNQPRKDYGLTGYFTALNDGSGTLLIYVLDIVDRNGNRLHRINGQERSTGTSPDPWRSIEDDQLANAADRTMQSVSTWIASQKS